MRQFRSSLSLVFVLGGLGALVATQLAACSGGTAGTDSIDNVDDTGATTTDSSNTDTADEDTSGNDTAPADTGAADTGGSETKPGECTGPVTITGCGVDTDCDGITDTLEGRYDPAGAVDTDKDGKPDYLDDDSDGDGVPDAFEWRKAGCDTPTDEANDVDGDGIPNFQDDESDGNGILDKDEVCPPAAVLTKLGMPACVAGTPYDFDGDGTPDFLDIDNDHDSSKSDKTLGLADKIEVKKNDGTFGGLALDTDGDGIPDLYDVDSDNDFILDLDDGTLDDDGDNIPAFRDTDTDGDGVPDRCEARGKASPSAADYSLALTDTDLDGVPDYRDIDSDEDFLADGKEDLDGDCVVDASETDRVKADTDGDGAVDLAEVVLSGTAAAKDATKTPAKDGKFFFIVPYSPDGSKKPSPTTATLALSTTLQKGDVSFMIDTTYSMADIEAALRSSIASKIIPGLSAKIADLALGVVGYDDALAKPWGDTVNGTTGRPDSFIWFPGGSASMGSRLTTSTADAITAANGLVHVTPGGSFPEGSVPALWWALTGDSMSFRAGSGYPDVTKTFPGVTAPAGRFGGLHFRDDALSIVIQASDANMHNGLTNSCLDGDGVLASPCGPIAYSTEGAKASSLGHSPTINELRDKMVSLGARYIGVSVHGGTASSGTARSSLVNRTTNPAYYQASLDMLHLARGTGSKVPPSVLGGTSTNCNTHNTGATVLNAPDLDGQCPLVFDIRYDGVGLGDTVVNAVVALVNAIRLDVHVQAIPVISGGVDPVNAFLANVPPMPGGGTDPVTGGACVTFPATQTADRFTGPKALAGTDTVKETILDLVPGPLHCFAVTPKPNTTVPATTTAQVFRANLQAHAQKPTGATSPLGTMREVVFVVPPILN